MEVKSPPLSDGRISCHYPHLTEGYDIEDILKPQIETVNFHFKCVSREEFQKSHFKGGVEHQLFQSIDRHKYSVL